MTGRTQLPHPGVFLGDFTDEGTTILAVIPGEATSGAQINALHVLTREVVEGDGQNYWLMQLGQFERGVFKLSAPEISFSEGFPVAGSTVAFTKSPVLASRGTRLVLRMTPRGAPPPLVGLSVAVEWGILTVDTSSA